MKIHLFINISGATLFQLQTISNFVAIHSNGIDRTISFSKGTYFINYRKVSIRPSTTVFVILT